MFAVRTALRTQVSRLGSRRRAEGRRTCKKADEYQTNFSSSLQHQSQHACIWTLINPTLLSTTRLDPNSQTSVASRGYASAAKAQSLKDRLAELIPKEIENVSRVLGFFHLVVRCYVLGSSVDAVHFSLSACSAFFGIDRFGSIRSWGT